MAKGRLTKNEKYIIEGMLKDNHTLAEVAKEVGRAQKTIEKYQRETKKKRARKKAGDAAKGAALKAKDLMVRKTMGKNSDGVAIMTEAASAKGDNPIDLEPSRTFRDAIYRPNSDE